MEKNQFLKFRKGCLEISGYKGWRFQFVYESGGYFDKRPQLNISFIYWTFYIHLPFIGKWDECETPRYGFAVHQTYIVFYYGFNKRKYINYFWNYTWIRSSKLRNDGTWEHSTKKDNKDFFESQWNDVLWTAHVKYNYQLREGTIQERVAIVQVSEIEWRRKCFKWTKLGAKIRKSIDVEFDDEIGEETGSWKGGVVGCGYDMLPHESPHDTLRRMEKERKFR